MTSTEAGLDRRVRNNAKSALESSYEETGSLKSEVRSLKIPNKSHNGEPKHPTHGYLAKSKDRDKEYKYLEEAGGAKMHRCEFCDKGFSCVSQLLVHRRVHTNDRPFECNVCQRRFKQKAALQSHEKTHQSDKPHKCKKCGTCFKRLKTLQQHMKLPICKKKMMKNNRDLQRNVSSEEDEGQAQNIHEFREEFQDRIAKGTRESGELEKIHCCDLCDKSFWCDSQLQRHRRVHTGERPFECKVCKRCFKQKGTLQDHEKTHLMDKPHKCEKCGSCFKQLRTLHQHMKLPICERKMKKGKGLHSNVIEVVEEKLVQMQSMDEFKVRVQKESGEFDTMYRCEFCQKDFKGGSLLQRHRRVHTNERPFECKICQRRFKQKTTLEGHAATHLSNKPFKCEKCGTAFRQRSTLRKHMTLPVCEKKMMKNSRDLERKQTSSVGGDLDEFTNAIPDDSTLTESQELGTGYSCGFCGKIFKNDSLLKRHRRIHTDERPFECQICHRSFKQKTTLYYHEKTHLSDKPHKCEKCGTCFKQLRSLRQHMRLPICEKTMLRNKRDLQRKVIVGDTEDVDVDSRDTVAKHHCSFCDKAFQYKSQLETHHRIHTDERPFRCKTCHRRFKQKGSLKGHEKTHLSNKPHKCEKCGTRFKQLRLLRQHMRLPICEKKMLINKEQMTKFEGEKNEDKTQLAPSETQQPSETAVEKVVEDNELETRSETEVSDYGLKNQECITVSDDTGTAQRELAQCFVCDICDKGFQGKKNLRQHKKTHTKERPFACSICNKEFKMKSTLVEHMNVHTEGKSHSCQTCNKSFKTKKCLRNHTLRNICSGDRPYSCMNCNKVFLYQSFFEKHKCGGRSRKIFECEDCDRKFTRRNLLVEHRRLHTGERPLECEECGKRFAKRRLLRRHRLSHKESSFASNDPGMGLAQMPVLQGHMAGHSEDRKYVCKVCSRAFKVASSLCNHLKVVHGEESHMMQAKPGYHHCARCGKYFKHLKRMLNHLCEASAIKRFPCSTCGKSFKYRHQLEVHSRVHSGVRPFSCPQCEKSFSLRRTLQDHLVTHTGEKNFKCDRCGSSFTRKNSLRKHKLIIHQGVEPFICNKCGLTFKYKKYYKAHDCVCKMVPRPVGFVQTETGIAENASVLDHNKVMPSPDLEQQVLDNILGNIERAINGAGIEIRPHVQYEIIVGDNVSALSGHAQ